MKTRLLQSIDQRWITPKGRYERNSSLRPRRLQRQFLVISNKTLAQLDNWAKMLRLAADLIFWSGMPKFWGGRAKELNWQN